MAKLTCDDANRILKSNDGKRLAEEKRELKKKFLIARKEMDLNEQSRINEKIYENDENRRMFRNDKAKARRAIKKCK